MKKNRAALGDAYPILLQLALGDALPDTAAARCSCCARRRCGKGGVAPRDAEIRTVELRKIYGSPNGPGGPMKKFRAARALGEVNQSAPDLDGPGQSLFFSRFSDHGPLLGLGGVGRSLRAHEWTVDCGCDGQPGKGPVSPHHARAAWHTRIRVVSDVACACMHAHAHTNVMRIFLFRCTQRRA